MIHAIGKYATIPQSSDMSNKFNGWASNTFFAALNDFTVADKRDIIETLKPIITDKIIAVQSKGVDQRAVKNHIGIMITTNHKDGVVKTIDDRRFAVFHTDQQYKEDLKRCGMVGNYFAELNQWLDADGYAIVADMLDKRVVVDYPYQAPITSSHDAAIEDSQSGWQTVVSNAIKDGESGFKNDLVIEGAVKSLLMKNDLPSKVGIIKKVMHELGYVDMKRTKIGGVSMSIYVKASNTILKNSSPKASKILEIAGGFVSPLTNMPVGIING